VTARVEPELQPAAPFRGIDSFRYIDHPIFFARREQTVELLRRVVIYRGVLLFGESGAGKSSLVNAGLVPLVMEEGFIPERLRVQPREGEEIIVERFVLSEEPRRHLRSQLAGDSGAPRVVLAVDALRERLNELDAEHPPLLIFDQFEEIVTQFEEAPSGLDLRSRKRSQQKIVELIGELLENQTRRMKLLFAFREDYLAKVADLLAEHAIAERHYVRLTPPGAAVVPAIVRGPFKRFEFDNELSEELAKRIEREMDQRAGGGRISLSELQIVCLRLWQSHDPATELTEKGIQGLLEDYLGDALDQFPVHQQYTAVAALSRMITPSGARNVISEENLIGYLHDEEGIDSDETRSTLAALEEQAHLIRRELRRDVPFYEITSEFLAPWIRRQRESLPGLELLGARARWNRDVELARQAMASQDDAEQRRAVNLLASVLFQTRDVDTRIYVTASQLLERVYDLGDGPVVKKARQALQAAELMGDDDALSYVHLNAPRLRGTPEQRRAAPSRPLLWLAAGFYLFVGIVSGLVAGLALDQFDPLGTEGLPAGWWAAAGGIGGVWAVIYMAEALDAGGHRFSLFDAMLHPYSWGDYLWETSSGWPLNFILSWGGAYLLGWAANGVVGVGFAVAFFAALLITSGAWMLAFNEAVVLW
jgi:Novel STAND NTPase 1